MSQNLLQNPGFEADWWRKTHIGVEFGEIFVPEGWTAYWKEGFPVPHDPQNQWGYRRPECKLIPKVDPFIGPPCRIHAGYKAWQCFTFFGIHEAGLYQQVSGVAPGSTLRANCWAHAWSCNRDDKPADWSEGAGQGPYLALEGTVTNSDVRNFTFRVGIDPTGGTDPWASSVVWGQGAHIYNAYAQVPTVETIAQRNVATVFLLSSVLWGFKHCDAYFDAVELTAEGGLQKELAFAFDPPKGEQGEPVTVSVHVGEHAPSNPVLQITDPLGNRVAAPHAHLARVDDGYRVQWKFEPDRAGTYALHFSAGDGGQTAAGSLHVAAKTTAVEWVPPRVAYARSYLLLPPDADRAWFQAVLDSGAWDKHRWTIGSSADDAGAGPVARKVIAVNPNRWPSDLRAFFDTYYKGIEYVPVVAATPAELKERLARI